MMTWLAVFWWPCWPWPRGSAGLIALVGGNVPGMRLLMGLTAVMMPYMVFICLAAQVAATLQALSHFSVPALAPAILNLCWLLAVWGIAPRFAPDKQAQAYAIAVAVLVSGVLQLAVQLLMLPRLGFRYRLRLGRQPRRAWGDRAIDAADDAGTGHHPDQHSHGRPDCLGAGRAPDGPQSHPLAGLGRRLPDDPGSRGLDLLERAILGIPRGDLGRGRGHGDLSALEPACRPGRPSRRWPPISRSACGWCCFWACRPAWDW